MIISYAIHWVMPLVKFHTNFHIRLMELTCDTTTSFVKPWQTDLTMQENNFSSKFARRKPQQLQMPFGNSLKVFYMVILTTECWPQYRFPQPLPSSISPTLGLYLHFHYPSPVPCKDPRRGWRPFPEDYHSAQTLWKFNRVDYMWYLTFRGHDASNPPPNSVHFSFKYAQIMSYFSTAKVLKVEAGSAFNWKPA